MTIPETPENDDIENLEYLKADDPVLNLLNHYAGLGAHAGVTLLIQGSIVTGTLITQREYYELSIAWLREAKDVFAGFYDGLLKGSSDREIDPNETAPNYRYLHLKNARVFQDGVRGLPSNGSLIRVRQSEVSGWHMGTLTAS